MSNIKDKVGNYFDNAFSSLISDLFKSLIFFLLPVVGSALLGIGVKATLLIALVLLAIIVFAWVISRTTLVKNVKIKKIYGNIEMHFQEHLENSGSNSSFYDTIVFPVIEGEDKRNYGDIREVLEDEQFVEIIAMGGAGKTTLLQYIVYNYISKGIRQFIKEKRIPFYVSLNKIVNYEGECFISDTINHDYCKNALAGDKAFVSLKKLLTAYNKCEFILLLDGFNELRDEQDRERIISELTKLVAAQNIKVIITSRSDIAKTIDKASFTKVTIHGFTEDVIRHILREENIQEPDSKNLYRIIQNPLMLSVYKKLCVEERDLESVNNETMLLQRYFITQEKLGVANDSQVVSKVIYRMIIPYVGYSLETKSMFNVSGQRLREAIINAFDFLKNVLIVDNMEEIETILSIDNEEFDEALILANEAPVERIEKHIINDLAIIVKSGTGDGNKEKAATYSFYHQIFRDYFSALHIMNQTCLSLKKSDLFLRVMPGVIASYYCHLCGENIDFNEEGGVCTESGKKIYEILERISHISNSEPGYHLAVRNVFDLMIKVHGGLYGFKYQNIDMSKYAFNGVLMTQNSGQGTVTSQVVNCVVDYLRFCPQGHIQWVYSVAKVDADTVVSCGRDGKIKLWNIPLSYCEYTLDVEHDEVKFVQYNDGNIFAATNDGFVMKLVITEDRRLCVKASIRLEGSTIISILTRRENLTVVCKNGNIYQVNRELTDIKLIKELGRDVCYATINYSSQSIYVCSVDRSISEVKLGTFAERRVYKTNQDIKCIACNKEVYDKELLIVTDNVYILDCDANRIRVLEYPSATPIKAIYCDSYNKAIAVYSDNNVVLWNLKTETYDYLYSHDDVIEDVLVIEESGMVISASRDFSIIVFDLKLGMVIDCFKGESFWIRKIVSSSYREQIYIPSTDGSIKIFDSERFVPEAFLVENDVRAYSVCEVGNCLVSALIDGSLSLWDVDNRKVLHRISTGNVCMDDVEAVGGNCFVGINSANEVFLWKVEDNRIVLKDNNSSFVSNSNIPGTAVNSIYYFPEHNGKSIVVSLHWNNQIGVWIIENDKLVLCSRIRNAINLEAKCLNEDWPYCATEILSQEDGSKELLVSSRKGYINKFDIDVSGDLEFKYANDCYLSDYTSSLYSMIVFGEYIISSTAKGELLVYKGREQRLLKQVHDSRIFILKKLDDRHFLSYSEDGKMKRYRFENEDVILCDEVDFVPGLFLKNCIFYDNEERNIEKKDLVESYI